MTIKLTTRERLKRLRIRNRLAKSAIRFDTSIYHTERHEAFRYWEQVERLDKEIEEG